MLANDWLKQAQSKLVDAGIPTARLDCLVLLEDATTKTRAWLLAHPEFELPTALTTILDSKVYRRARHVPLAYIRGKAEFYGREFAVNAHTLVPRPETETLIDMLKHVSRLEATVTTWEDEGHKRRSRNRQPAAASTRSLAQTDEGYKVVWNQRVVKNHAPGKPAEPVREHLSVQDRDLHLIDVGTGSGAIAVTAKLELPDATVTALDIDEKCLETARVNAVNLQATIACLQGNLLEPLLTYKVAQQTARAVLLCNLPYIPDNFQINTAATHEPRHALFGGVDGLDLYRELFGQIQQSDMKPAYILCESLPPQHESLTAIAKAAGYALRKTDDFIQLFEPA